MSILVTKCQDFQMVFNICCIKNHNNVEQKLKELTDIHPNKIESEKYLNKETVQRLQGLRNVC